jgi:hypothetical protein
VKSDEVSIKLHSQKKKHSVSTNTLFIPDHTEMNVILENLDYSKESNKKLDFLNFVIDHVRKQISLKINEGIGIFYE